MPVTKSRTVRRKKRWVRRRYAGKSPAAVSSPGNAPATDSPAISPAMVATSSSTPTIPKVVTASLKKLSMSPFEPFDDSNQDSDSSSESDGEMEGQGCRLFELEGLVGVFQSLACGKCGEKSLEYREDFSKRLGVYTAPYIFCNSCSCQVSIPFTTVGDSKVKLFLLPNV